MVTATPNVFALTYCSDVQWVKNVVAAGAAGLQTRVL